MAQQLQTITVNLGERSYPIYLGKNIIAQAELITQHCLGQQVMIVTNQTIAPLYLDQIRHACSQIKQCDQVILPDGEEYKTLTTMNMIIDELIKKQHKRSTTLIALGGGVIGDITGFAAACYQRGVGFIQLPTTLLAQVDSSIGGKTAVNHPLAKNMIGAFYQPKAVIIDIDTLNTLPEREFRAGLAEVIKYGLIYDNKFFAWLEQNAAKLLARDETALIYSIKRSCEIKATIVASDERESGLRAILNYGHTFGHAIEAGLGYGRWLHGEAIAAGMVLAASLSQQLNLLSKEDVERISHILQAVGLPITLPKEISSARLVELMAHDKKADDQGLRFITLKGIGQAIVTHNVNGSTLLSVLNTQGEY